MDKYTKRYKALHKFVTTNGGSLDKSFKTDLIDVRRQLNKYTRTLRATVKSAYVQAAQLKNDATRLYDAYLLAVNQNADVKTIKVLRRKYTAAIRAVRKFTITAYTLSAVAKDIDTITGARTR